MKSKLFIGPRVRALRHARAVNLEGCAAQLGISASYLSQIEANQRPVTSRVLISMVELFDVSMESLEADEADRVIADLRTAVAEVHAPHTPVPLSEIRTVALQAPALARRFLDLHRANLRLNERLNLTEAAVSLDEMAAASSLLPYEEVRDFFHDKDNYLDGLDRAAEALSADLDGEADLEAALAQTLHERLGVTVRRDAPAGVIRRYEPASRTLSVNARHAAETRAFQLAFHLVSATLEENIEDELAAARFRTREGADVCRVGLANYAAGALLMPYRRFTAAARELRHDVERLALTFGVSLEQVCHRLSTLQRPGERGVPLYFVRLDYAGNITKRHSATRLRFARFGGACPLWNVHEAVGAGDRFLVQVVEMPDGVRYLSVARAIVKRSRSYLAPDRRYVLGFGCEITEASAFVYSAGIDLAGPAAPIGVSCRICERIECPQRAFPPVDRPLQVLPHERRDLPYSLL